MPPPSNPEKVSLAFRLDFHMYVCDEGGTTPRFTVMESWLYHSNYIALIPDNRKVINMRTAKLKPAVCNAHDNAYDALRNDPKHNTITCFQCAKPTTTWIRFTTTIHPPVCCDCMMKGIVH